MKKICEVAHNLSTIDHKAMAHFTKETPNEWINKALSGWINKAVKTIMADWFSKYKEQSEMVSYDPEVVIPLILAMPEFKEYGVSTPSCECVNRTESSSVDAFNGGFEIKDYEYAALNAYYSDIESYLCYLMENKIYSSRKAFKNEYAQVATRTKELVPSNEDDFISYFTEKTDYKNAEAREAEINNV